MVYIKIIKTYVEARTKNPIAGLDFLHLVIFRPIS